MPPQVTTSLFNETTETPLTKAGPWKYQLKYIFVVGLTYFHLAGVYGLYLALTSAKWQTNLFGYATFCLCGLGLFAGAHRLFAHNSYKAAKPLQIFLMLCQSIAYQKSLFTWVLDHRLHHKYSDTDGDPHNASRGMFFSHIGWLLCKKHPESTKRIKKIDMSDIYSNPIVMYQKKHQLWLLPMFAFVVPTIIPILFWYESFNNSWHVNITRYIFSMHSTFLLNSLSHKWGTKRYDKTIGPSQNIIGILVGFGEGFHNFHHVFPCDYRSAEIGAGLFNISKVFIELCAFFGLAYDLKTVTKDVILARMERTGDGSGFWGFQDDTALY